MAEPETPKQEQAEEQRRKRQRSVVIYIAILFIAAFVLLMMSMLMERRQNAETINSLNQSLSGLRDSVSAMQSAQELYEENTALRDEIDKLKASLTEQANRRGELTTEIAELTQRKDFLEKQIAALDCFWQVNEAYVRNSISRCRELIEYMERENLGEYLPEESVSGEDQPSPAQRYQEIHNALFGES